MDDDPPPTTSVAFTPAVKAVQEQLGSREAMLELEASGRWPSTISDDLAAFLARRDSVFLGTASADGRPYIQHRGGRPGFIEVLDERTLRIPDYPGNRQYLSLGNLSENDRAFLFAMDYETRTRIKIWGRARVQDLQGEDGGRALLFTLEAWDVNCRSHLPEMYSRATVEAVTARLRDEIAALELELARLRGPAGD